MPVRSYVALSTLDKGSFALKVASVAVLGLCAFASSSSASADAKGRTAGQRRYFQDDQACAGLFAFYAGKPPLMDKPNRSRNTILNSATMRSMRRAGLAIN